MEKLLEEVRIEKEHILKTLEVLHEASNRPEMTVVELTAIGASLHHCYNGVENILKRILKYQNVPLIDSSSSHKDLLDTSIEHGIISIEMSNQLDQYRGFRHFFVHAYGILLNKEECQPLIEALPNIWKQFEREIETFLNKNPR